jgi:hypothetical protein
MMTCPLLVYLPSYCIVVLLGSVADPHKKKMLMRIQERVWMRIRIHALTELWRAK